MTPAERRQPKILNGSRRMRIAKGSGMTVTDVNSLVNRFEQAAKMMKTLSKGGVPQMPGMPNVPGIGGFGSARAKGKDKGKKGSKSGNPAKRAAEEAARLAGGKPAAGGDSGSGSAFGLGN
jgi:signal recognition particle subunit SRP54